MGARPYVRAAGPIGILHKYQIESVACVISEGIVSHYLTIKIDRAAAPCLQADPVSAPAVQVVIYPGKEQNYYE